MLVRLLYASRPAEKPDDAVLGSIFAQSRRNNPPRGITGVLCFAPDVYIQVLEGGRDAVCELFSTLVGDARHRQVRILAYEEIAERRFGGWTMGGVDVRKTNPTLLLKYGEKPELDPFTGSGRTSMDMLEALIATGNVTAWET